MLFKNETRVVMPTKKKKKLKGSCDDELWSSCQVSHRSPTVEEACVSLNAIRHEDDNFLSISLCTGPTEEEAAFSLPHPSLGMKDK